MTLGSIKVDVGFQPGLLTELEHPLDLGDAKTVVQSLLQVSVMNLIAVLVIEGGEELLVFGT